jgi:hypothetical protein
MIPARHPAATTAWRTVPPAAAALFAASLLTMVMLAHHPVAAHHAGAELVADLAQQGRAAALVHAMITVLVGALLYGVVALALRLDLRRPGIAFGLAVYGLGCAAMTGAMLLDGFATSAMAGWLLAHGAAAGHAAAAGIGAPDIASLALIAIGIQVLTKAGFVGMGAGMLCLSWSRASSSRLLAALALPAGLLPAVAVIGGTTVAPHSLIVLTALQAPWYLAAAWTLWRVPQP